MRVYEAVDEFKCLLQVHYEIFECIFFLRKFFFSDISRFHVFFFFSVAFLSKLENVVGQNDQAQNFTLNDGSFVFLAQM